jgi:hypothetical protein
VTVLLAASAVLSGIFFIIRKSIPETPVFRILGIIYLLAFGVMNYSEYHGYGIPFAPIISGVAALLCGGYLLVTIQRPKKPIYFSSYSFALFLFIVAAKTYSNYLGDYETWTEMQITITSVVTAFLLWRDV